MDAIRSDQIITLVLFLGFLGLLWLVVRINRGGLGAKLRQGKRISVEEVTALSPTDRGIILKIDEREFFVLKSKGLTPVVMPLPKAEVAE